MADLGQFQPLYPEERVLAPLIEQAADLIVESHRLAAHAGEPLIAALRPQLRAMNSYYTNKIEGQQTKPADIERALRKEYDADILLAKKQRLAVAHINVEQALEEMVGTLAPRELFAARFVSDVHRLLYDKLPKRDRITEDHKPIIPGEYRTDEVTVGRHLAPSSKDVQSLVEGWAARYRTLAGNEALIVGAACSHQRLAWIHAFIDGNGRVARLHTHLVFHSMGLLHGLWSPMRGLARTHEQYYARLNNADLPRRNDINGRGPLSQEGLVAFARYFLDICSDQVRFMRDRLEFAALKDHLQTLLLLLQQAPWQVGSEKSVVKIEAVEALHYVAITGPVERSRFIAMTGLGERTGRRVLASLLDYGLLSSPSPRGPVTFAPPLASLAHLFPNLWPEAETP